MVLPLQSTYTSYPKDFVKAAWIALRVYVFELDGVMPADWRIWCKQAVLSASDISCGVSVVDRASMSYRVRVKRLEKVDYCLKEVDDLLARCIACVTRRVERVDACTVRGPFVLPEGFVRLVIRDPVLIHVVQQRGLASGIEDGSDVLVVARGVAVLLIRPITVIGPGNGISVVEDSQKGVG